jgi:hypothetical protein
MNILYIMSYKGNENYESNVDIDDDNNNAGAEKATERKVAERKAIAVDNANVHKITTAHGCTCKSEYIAHDVKIKNKCTLLGDSEPWCHVEGTCGKAGIEDNEPDKYWDYCNRTRESIFSPRYIYGKHYYYRQLFGSLIFLVIFVLLIPSLMYKYKLYSFLSVYMPNFDLIASSITYNGGPYNWEIFNELYPTHIENVYAYISALFINLLSLLGVVYLVSSTVKKSKSLIKGFIVGLVMVMITYLLPNDIITSSQYYISTYLIDTLKMAPDTNLILYIIVTIFGLFIATLFILIEEYIVIRHDDYIIKISKWISNKLWGKVLY